MIFVRLRLRFVALCLVALMAAQGAVPVAAAPPTSASGTFAYSGDPRVVGQPEATPFAISKPLSSPIRVRSTVAQPAKTR
jgi:hypothetical protein